MTFSYICSTGFSLSTAGRAESVLSRVGQDIKLHLVRIKKQGIPGNWKVILIAFKRANV